MRAIPRLAVLAVCAVATNAVAQTPPLPPTPPPATVRPLPAPSPRPSRAPTPPARSRAPQAVDDYWSAKSLFDADAFKLKFDLSHDFDFKFDQQRLSEQAQERAQEAVRRAQELQERGQERALEAQERALDAARRVQDLHLEERLAPLARLGGQYATTFGRDFASQMGQAFDNLPAISPRWQSDWGQDRDPADSLFNVARDAMNRGDWRRAADLYAQVYSRYPKSTRIPAAAYYEAFMRYRIGTTDELRTALRVLTERAKGSSNTSNSNEVSVLTTRVRGALAARGDAEAARQLANDAQRGANCDNEDMQVRAEALSALAQSDMTAATPMLRRVLDRKDPCTLELRRRALGILLRRADTAATSAAISVAKNNDETLDLRTDAISYLSRLPGDNALAALEDLMRTSNDRDVQRAAVRSLSNTENPRARQAVRALIERNDVSERLRVEAINTFERDRGGNTDDAAYLRSIFPKLQSEQLKFAAIAAISKTAGSENEQFVLSLARNTSESSEVRTNAISRMYRMPAISIADIGKLYDVSDSRSMRDQIVNVLSQRKEPEAIDKLGDIAKSGTDGATRRQAINALLRKDDPRAKKLLADIVGNP